MSRPEDRTVLVSPKQPRAVAPQSGQRRPASSSLQQSRRPAVWGGVWLAIAIGCGFGASFALTLRFSRPTFNPMATILQSEQDFPEATFPGTSYSALESRHGAVDPPASLDTWSAPPSTAIVPDPVIEAPFDPIAEQAEPPVTDPAFAEPPLSATDPSWATPEPAPVPDLEPSAPSMPEPTAPSPTAPPLQ